MSYSKITKFISSGILAVTAYIMLSTTALASDPPPPTPPYYPAIVAKAVCLESGKAIVKYESTAWIADNIDISARENPQIDILLNLVLVDSQPYAAPDYSFFGSSRTNAFGEPITVEAVAVGDWGDGTAGGQSTSVTVTVPESCPYCGDGNLDPGEQCDDGNNEDGDKCSAICTIEPFCGDFNLDPGEGCDDGNNLDGDGCSASCTIESYCGDGFLDQGELCDDGNNIDGDGCDSSCMIEPFCGDGNVDPGELCDDGNNINGDGCSAVCTVEGGGQGCTPGYWKQPHHFDSWTAPYTPDTLFSASFEDAFEGLTLLQVMEQGGGKLNALGRHTVAGLLNAANTDVSYDKSTNEVIDMFNSTYPDDTSSYNATKNALEFYNEQGCPLN